MSSLIPPYDADEYEEADVTEDGMVLIAGVLYDEETLEEAEPHASGMVARTTDQGTAASETALCDEHDTPTNRGVYGIAADTDVVGPYIDVTGNEAVRCQVCGAFTDHEDYLERERQRLLEMLDEAGAEDEYDWPPVDLNPEGDPTRNGAFR